jgi:hypothetical protein
VECFGCVGLFNVSRAFYYLPVFLISPGLLNVSRAF